MKEAGVYRVALSEGNRNQDPAFCQESSHANRLRSCGDCPCRIVTDDPQHGEKSKVIWQLRSATGFCENFMTSSGRGRQLDGESENGA
jgi:hypothetical protein